MRRFADDHGVEWVASVADSSGGDYKGRFHLILHAETKGTGPVALTDVRWNSRKTADRTLRTMSGAELKRRLRSARGRGTAR